MNNINNIKLIYGNDAIRKVRSHEKLSKTIGRYRSHLRFNLQCKHSDITPKSLKLKYHSNNSDVQQILKKAEKAMINIRIKENLQKTAKLRRNLEKIERELQNILDNETFNEMKDINRERERLALEKASISQKKKYLALKSQCHINVDIEVASALTDSNQNNEQQAELAQNTEVINEMNHTTDSIEAEGNPRRSNRARNNPNYREMHLGRNTTSIAERPNETLNQAEDTPLEQPTNIPEPSQHGNNINLVENQIEEPPWYKNLSKRELTRDEISVLSKGEGFAVTPKEIPIEDFIVATEQVCRGISSKGQQQAIRGEIHRILENEKPPVSNLSKKERIAMQTLKNDKSIVIVPADKGRCLVVLDKEEYTSRMEEKLKDENTYKKLNQDPTNKIREELADKLQEIHSKKHIKDYMYNDMFPSTTQIPRLSGRPKIHKQNYPLREIVDSRESVTKNTDKHISKIIKPYAEDNKYRIKNSEEFVERIKNMPPLEEDDQIVSYDVVALYPSIPQEEALDLVHMKLSTDQSLGDKTEMTAKEVIELLKICVCNTYFVFNGVLYGQVSGLAIGASCSGFMADIFMERIEVRALSTFTNPPKFWCRFVDDAFANRKSIVAITFLAHLNAQHRCIKWTQEEESPERKLPYVDCMNQVLEDGTIKITIFRKPTHTNQYLNFSSNHHVSHKLSVPKTLFHRADTLISEEDDKEKEKEYVKKALRKCGYPEWSFERKEKEKPKKDDEEEEKMRVCIPYIKHLSEKIAGEFRKHSFEVMYTPTTKLKNILCNNMKDRIPDLDKAGVNYYFHCKAHQDDYDGETGRPNKERQYEHGIIPRKKALTSEAILEKKEEKQHQNATRHSHRLAQKEQINYKELSTGSNIKLTTGNTAISEHMALLEHKPGDVSVKIIRKENDKFKRGVREAINIKKHQPTLNKDLQDRFYLQPIYDNIIKPEDLKTRLSTPQI